MACVRDNNPALLEYAERLIIGRLYDEARQLLSSHLKNHRNSDLAWYLLSFTLTDRGDRIRCLERSLAIYPHNMTVQERLDKINPGGSTTKSISPFATDGAEDF